MPKSTAPAARLLSIKQAAIVLGLSVSTLARLDAAGDGPPRVRLSPRRVGYAEDRLRTWLESREAQGGKRAA